MPTTIAHNSKETMSELIRNEFDRNTNIWQRSRCKELIKTARDFGLNDVADSMENDLN